VPWYALRRLALLVPLIFGVILVAFALMHLVPGDPAVVLLGQDATPAAAAELRRELGLDRPAGVQVVRYLWSVVRGDLGRSIFRHEPVLSAFGGRLPATVELAGSAVAVALLLGLALGIGSALKPGSWIDRLGLAFAQVGVSLPVFWLGVLMMFCFAVVLNWLPSVGRGEPLLPAAGRALAGRPQSLADAARHLALPALALGTGVGAVLSRLVRSSMVEALSAGFVRAARGKGLTGRRVVLVHALRNALLPVITVLGLRFGELLGGAVLTESVFGWPGVGQLAVTAIAQRDIPLVQGVVLVFALLFAGLNLAVDLLNAWLDPRIRLR
jgi:peptide/nickel transport system permease protein